VVKVYIIKFSRQADKDKKLLKGAGLEKKAKQLLNIMAVNPFQNPPPYEKLIGNLSGNYSRRINIQHRLIYEIFENENGFTDVNNVLYEGIILVKRMWTHYE
jgi:Txe/YoeB family toxin of toxin-antitoxin system